ncbi:DinB family protein [Priestia flexa]|uniref:DinB family protein n=1 Tax=Priestia flexa TaxID=86664 RepID=UPI003D2EC87F
MNTNQAFREELLETVSTLSYKELNQKVSEEKWSIMQVLEHLYLMEEMIVARVYYQLQNGEDKPAQKKPFHLTTDRSRKVPAPPQVTPSEEPQTLEEMKMKLATSRTKLEDITKRVATEELQKKSFPHPIFGDMDLAQWIEFVGYHEKRHLLQIEELKAEMN